MVSLGPAPTISSPSLCGTGTDVYRQFGLRHPLVVQLLEQLPNSEKCSGYHFTYHRPEKLSSWQATVSFFMACLSSLFHSTFLPFLACSSFPYSSFSSTLLPSFFISLPSFPHLSSTPSPSSSPPLPPPHSPSSSFSLLLSSLQRAAFNPSGSARSEPFCG